MHEPDDDAFGGESEERTAETGQKALHPGLPVSSEIFREVNAKKGVSFCGLK